MHSIPRGHITTEALNNQHQKIETFGASNIAAADNFGSGGGARPTAWPLRSAIPSRGRAASGVLCPGGAFRSLLLRTASTTRALRCPPKPPRLRPPRRPQRPPLPGRPLRPPRVAALPRPTARRPPAVTASPVSHPSHPPAAVSFLASEVSFPVLANPPQPLPPVVHTPAHSLLHSHRPESTRTEWVCPIISLVHFSGFFLSCWEDCFPGGTCSRSGGV